MSRIFLSHSSIDNFEAIAVRDWLASEGWDDVFLDLDPERGIAAGERWERALYAAANRCEAVIFLVSPNWLASDWCLQEYGLARGLNKKLFAVLISPKTTLTDLPAALTGTWQVINLTGSQDLRIFGVPLPGSHEEKHVGYAQEGLRRLKRGLEKAGLDPKYFPWPPAIDPRRAPYRGLKALESSDAGIFFGRDASIVEGTDRLRGLHAGAAPRILVILGASGAGKSSFLRAGLLPRLERDDSHFLPLPVIRPEKAALYGDSGLLGALEAALPGSSRAALRAAVSDGATGIRPLFAKLVAQVGAQHVAGDEIAKPPAIVIAVDQAEELFRAEGDEEGAALLDLLRELMLSDDPAVVAIFAIRSDAYDALENAPALEGLAQTALPLLPMPRGAFTEVINGPARRLVEGGGKLAIEPQLTQQLLRDIESGGGSDALPLLAFTLEQLYLEYGGAGTLRHVDYQAFGGLKGAINAAVERAFAAADADRRIPRHRSARESLLRRGLIPWLAGIDSETKSPRRNIARRADIPAEAAPLIALLVEQRLLSTDTVLEKDSNAESEIRIATVEPAHEALLRQWGLLQGWLEEDFALLATLEGVKRAARDWDANARAAAWLAHQAQRLAEAQSLDERPDIAAKLDALDRAYLAACQQRQEIAQTEADQRRREREEEQTRRLSDARRLARRTAVGSIIAIILAVTVAGFAFYVQRQAAIAEEKAKEEYQQASEAFAATIKLRGSMDIASQNQSAALAAISKTVIRISPSKAVKLALAAWPRGPHGFTPKLDVALAALSAAVGQLRERTVMRGHEGYVYSAAFSPDGGRTVTASHDGTARLWDAVTGREIIVLRGHHGNVYSAAFSPDGARVVTASEDNTARVWDSVTGNEIIVLRGHEGGVFNAAFSPDGARVITVSQDKTARVWDAMTGKEATVLRGHHDSVSMGTFSPDGQRIVTASLDSTAELWDAMTGREIAVLYGHADSVRTAVFSPDGSRVLTASRDNTARVWDAMNGKEITVLRGHENTVWMATFSPDNTRVLTASRDNTARVWDSVTGKEIMVLRGHEGSVYRATFSPDGKRIVTASQDRTAQLWDAATGREIIVFRGHQGGVYRAAFSPDGGRVVTTSGDETIRVWDATTGNEITVLRHDDFVLSAMFSPDGARVVTASKNGAHLWGVADGKDITVLQTQTGGVRSVTFSPDGARVVTASGDGTARIWDAITGQEIIILRGHEDTAFSAVFSPDGARVVTASQDKTARVWDAVTGKEITVLRGHEDYVRSAAFSPDGARIVTASYDRTARLWDAVSGREIIVLRGHHGNVYSAAFSADGARVVTASEDNTARVWDSVTGNGIAVLRGHSWRVAAAAFSPDGALVVTASEDATVRIWDVATGKQITILRGHKDYVRSAAFSPDGTQIVTASDDKTARLWAVGTIPKGNIFQIACIWLPDHDLTDIAREYGLTNLEPICESTPPLPDALPQSRD